MKYVTVKKTNDKWNLRDETYMVDHVMRAGWIGQLDNIGKTPTKGVLPYRNQNFYGSRPIL